MRIADITPFVPLILRGRFKGIGWENLVRGFSLVQGGNRTTLKGRTTIEF